MGIEASVLIAYAAVAAAAVGAGASVYTSQASATKQKKASASMLAAQEKAVRDAEKKAAGAKSLAVDEARDKLRKMRLSQTSTILTSPLGIPESSGAAKNTLGG